MLVDIRQIVVYKQNIELSGSKHGQRLMTAPGGARIKSFIPEEFLEFPEDTIVVVDDQNVRFMIESHAVSSIAPTFPPDHLWPDRYLEHPLLAIGEKIVSFGDLVEVEGVGQ